jgi:hypothetical protein
MEIAEKTFVVERLVAPLGECLTLESARRLLALKRYPNLQVLIDEIAPRHTEGQPTPKEEA